MQLQSRKERGLFAAAILLLSLPALLAPAVGTGMAELLRAVDPTQPYLTLHRPELLYVLMPLSVLGTFALFMGPGMMLAFGLDRESDGWTLITRGFVLSLLLVSGTTAAIQGVIGVSPRGFGFWSIVFGLCLGAAAFLTTRPVSQAPESLGTLSELRVALIVLVLGPLALLVITAPKIFWESFNGDGAHALWAARLALTRALPFFPPEAGGIAEWPGVTGLVYPYVPSWYMRLFGETEASVRLPFFLLLPVLHASVVSFASARGRRPLGMRGHLLLFGSLLGFSLIMMYSATYNPYLADPSMPGVMDVLVMIFVFGSLAAYARGDRGWLIVLTLLALMASPAALPVFGMMVVAVFLVTRPLPWRRTLLYGVGLVACLALLTVLPLVFAALGTPPPGTEHGAVTLMRENYGIVSFMSIERFGYVILACGIYPMWCFIRWSGSDDVSRAVMLVAVGQFGMYYIMGAAPLHYFVPAMLLPLAVFWYQRQRSDELWGRRAVVLQTAGVVVTIGLALPATSSIHMATRTIGERIDVVGFDRDDPAVLDASSGFRGLFDRLVSPAVPDETFGVSSIALVYYANFVDRPSASSTYALVRAGGTYPRPGTRVATDSLAYVLVLDEQVWQSDRDARPLASLGTPVFVVPRDKLFARRSLQRRGAIDVGAIIERITS